jgi:hypothetical protein
MGAFESTASVVHLFARCEVRESCSPLSTRLRAPAGVPSLRMCRRRFEPPWAHSQGGHPREARDGEACISHQAGRRDGRRRPKAFEHEDRHTPPQGGEPERRRDQRRTRRQAGATEIRSHVPSDVAAERGPQQRAWRSQAPLKELRPASGRSATGGRLAPRHGPRRPPVTVSPLLVHRGPRESRASLSTRRGAPAGVPSLRMCRRRFEHPWAHSQGGTPGNGVPKKRAPATKQAIETPGGGRKRSSTRIATCHRRAASRSGGATSAERDGRWSGGLSPTPPRDPSPSEPMFYVPGILY